MQVSVQYPLFAGPLSLARDLSLSLSIGLWDYGNTIFFFVDSGWIGEGERELGLLTF